MPVPDCASCPSYLKSAETVSVFNRSIGSPMCGTYGHVLGRPGMTDAQMKPLREHFAGKCDRYGQPRASQPERRTEVMLPDPTVRNPDAIDPSKQALCKTCATCTNFVPESEVSKELGWNAGLCAAKGRLLFTNKLTIEARNCEYRQFGPVRQAVGGMHFLPEYDSAFAGGDTSPIAQYRAMKKKGGFIEPSEYPTDREVEEGDRAAGIRAWRKFVDPDGSGNEVFFPIYDPAFFDDNLRALIPKTGSDEHPELYVDHFGGMYGLGVAWMELDETPVFWGQPGVGKTELLRHAAWIMQLPFHRISITADSETDDIIGKMMYDPDKGTYFQYGRLPLAWQSPGVLCLDEPNVARDPAVWHAIRPLTDNSKQLVIDQNNSEALDRHTDCYMGMAMNPAWDTRNVGALEIADADANRLFHTYIEMPPPELEREIIQQRLRLDGWDLSAQQVDSLMATAKDIRALSDQRELSISWAIRPQIKVARALKWFSPVVAYRRAVGDFLEPDALQLLLDQVRANWSEI